MSPSPRNFPSERPLDHKFEVLDQINVTDGSMNAGIFVVREKRTGRVCIKKDFMLRDIQRGVAQREILILRSLEHRNVVEYIDAYYPGELGPKASLYMDMCDWGSLDDILNKHHENGWGFGEAGIWSTFKQLANAIGYIQYGIQDTVNGGRSVPGWKKILHRDLVPRNIFIKTWPGYTHPRVLIGDFGIAQVVDATYEAIGGYYEMRDAGLRPPESPAYGPASEIHCLALIILSMVKVQGFAQRYGPPLHPAVYWETGGNDYSDELKFAVGECMRRDWRRRPKIRELAPFLGASAEKAKYDPDWAFPEWDVMFDY